MFQEWNTSMRYTRKKLFKAAAALFYFAAFFKCKCKTCGKPHWLSYFWSSTKPLQLTEVGKHYIQAVEKVMDIENNLENYLLDLGNLKTGTLNVGGKVTFSSLVLPPYCWFSQNSPCSNFSCRRKYSKLSQFLQAGKLDLVIDNCILDNQIFEHYIYQKEQLLLAVPKNYSVNTRLQEYQILLRKSGTGSSFFSYSFCSIKQIRERTIYYSSFR